ncbi:MAG: DUF1007 family protein [Hyphomicrobiaceae bacterium]
MREFRTIIKYVLRHTQPTLAILAMLVANQMVTSNRAHAHPHVWVSVKTEVVFKNGNVTGFRHSWTFDDMYTAMAIQGLDKNKDGAYDRDELKELAQVNMDGLKQFSYFTHAKLSEEKLLTGAPQDYWLEHKDGILTLHFFLPLTEPVLAEAPQFTFSVYDPSFFIAFDFAKVAPIKISTNAPAGCGAKLSEPKSGATGDVQALGEAFFNELGGEDFGSSLARTVSIDCASS